MLASHGYFPVITLPTRVTNSSATIIDHIITNDNLHTLKPGVIRANLSDHYPIFCTISKIASKKTSPAVYQHKFANFKPDEFCTDLYDQLSSFLELHDSFCKDNFNHVFNKFIVTITLAIKKHAPLVKLTRSQRKLKLKPWITFAIFKSIKTKQSLHKTHFINCNDSHKQFYKKHSNNLTKIKFLAKQQYFKFKFEESKSNCYRSWRLIKSLISSCKKPSAPEMLQHNDLNITDPTSMANIYNDYFCNVGKTLAEKVPSCSSVNKCESYLHQRVSSCIFFSPTIPTEISHQINSLKNSKSCGYDEVSCYLLKVAANILAARFSYFFNSCFTLGIFPDCLKIAQLVLFLNPALKLTLQIIDRSQFFRHFQKFLKN